MSVLKIREKGDPCLNIICHKVTVFDRRLKLLVRDMKDTLLDACGVGLAAPQIGILRRVFVINSDGDVKVYINPEITEREGEQRPVEGCLSLPGVWGRVVRPQKVKIRAQDINGEWFEDEGADLIAEALDHENDHLNGKLFDGKIYEFVDIEKERADREKKDK